MFRLSATLAVSLVATATTFGTSAKSRVGAALSTQLIGEATSRFRAELKEGYHFNLKAPNQVSGGAGPSLKPSRSENQVLEFTIPKGRPLKGLQASLYVCDDANTFCDIERLSLTEAPVDVGRDKESTQAPAGKLGRVDRDGFYHADFSALLAKASREKKMIFVEFSARWCPGCRRFAAEVLPDKGFQRATAKMLKFHADMDLVPTFDVAKKYAVKGVPSVLVLDPSGEEIARLVDYRRPSEVVAFIQSVEARPVTLAKLKDLAAGPKAVEADLLLAGRRLLAAGRPEEAMAFFKRIEPAPAEYWQARVELSENLEKEKPSEEHRLELHRALGEALKAEPETLRALLWRGKLAALEEKASPARADAVKTAGVLARKLLALPLAELEKTLRPELVGEYVGMERFLIAVTWAEILDELGDRAAETRTAWQEAAEIGKRAGISTGTAGGPGLRYLIVLIAAEKFEEADQLCVKLIKSEPENKDLLRRRQVILNALKKYDEAVKVGEESRRFAEGRMEFVAIENLAKSYIGLGKAEAAKALLDQTLIRPELKLEKMKSQQARLELLRRSL